MDKLKSKKQLELLKVARELFCKHGFKRVTIEEVCQKAGVSKMTFYRVYSNKIELAKAVYDEEVNKGVQKFKAILAEDIDPRDPLQLTNGVWGLLGRYYFMNNANLRFQRVKLLSLLSPRSKFRRIRDNDSCISCSS